MLALVTWQRVGRFTNQVEYPVMARNGRKRESVSGAGKYLATWISSNALMAEMADALARGASAPRGVSRFKSGWAHGGCGWPAKLQRVPARWGYAFIAQLAEHRTCNTEAAGSTPAEGSAWLWRRPVCLSGGTGVSSIGCISGTTQNFTSHTAHAVVKAGSHLEALAYLMRGSSIGRAAVFGAAGFRFDP